MLGAPMAWHGIPQGTAWIATAPLGSPESAPPRALRAAAPTARSAAVPPGARRGRRAAPRPGFSANQAGFGDVNPQTYEYLNIKHLSQQKSRKWRKCGDVSSSAWCFPRFPTCLAASCLASSRFTASPAPVTKPQWWTSQATKAKKRPRFSCWIW